MKAISKEAKNLIVSLISSKIPESDIPEGYVAGLSDAIRIVESFPVSEAGKQNPSDNWIPCSERLPDNNEYVVVFQQHSSTVMEAYFSGGKWQSACEYQIARITHWQPLPNPPVN